MSYKNIPSRYNNYNRPIMNNSYTSNQYKKSPTSNKPSSSSRPRERSFTARAGDSSINTFLILAGIGTAGYLLYSYGKLKTEQGGNITKPVGAPDPKCPLTQDDAILKDAAQTIINEAGGYVNDQTLIAAMKVCKSKCDVDRIYGLCGEIDGWLLFDGDIFYQLRRMSTASRKTVKQYLFGYESQV